MSQQEEIRLARIEDGYQALQEANSIPQVKDIRDKAEAIRIYAKQRGSLFETQNQAAELKLRAERRLGELLHDNPEFGPGKKSLRLRDFGIDHNESSFWQQEATVDEDIFEAYITNTKSSGKELTTTGVLRLAKEARQTAHLDNLRASDSHTCGTSDLDEIITRGMTFGTIYADPPWAYSNQATRASTDNHYDTLTPKQIAEDFAPYIKALSKTDAHLHLWTTNAFIFDAKDIIEAWGFEYKSMLVWKKRQMGLGNYWRVSTEYLMLGVRGNSPFATHGLDNFFESDRGIHSAKPPEIRHMIERVSPPAYFELFGRRHVENWVVYGNQIEQHLFYQSLEEAPTERPPVEEVQLRLVQ